MKLAIIGTGYVGLVTGACLAGVGHRICCIDNDYAKVARLKQGVVDIYEAGLDDLVATGLKNGVLEFTDDIAEGLEGAQAVFIAVGTPPNEDGSTDLSHVLAVAENIGQTINEKLVVIIKSTVPVGTCHKASQKINDILKKRGLNFEIDVVSNPEFLKEGAAVSDFTRPDRIIVGCDSDELIPVLHDIYAPYNRRKDRMIVMSVVSAELTKYAANAMLATKISFINEMAHIAEYVGADIEEIRNGIGSDPRIGYDFIYAGCGYGGSCFPKDIKSLVNVVEEMGTESPLLESVDRVNERQKQSLYRHLLSHFNEGLKGKTIAVWGLAFKPETNDVREAASRVLMEALWQDEAKVRAYDPVAGKEIQAIYGDGQDLFLAESREQALEGADALVICTEWKEFRIPDFDMLKKHLANPVVIDGRNLYEPRLMEEHGVIYYGIGRGRSCQPATGIHG